MVDRPLNPVTDGFLDTSGNPTRVKDGTSPLPIKMQTAAGGDIDLTLPNSITPFLRTTKQLTPFVLNVNTAATFEIAAAVASQTTRLRRFSFETQDTVTVTLKNGAAVLRTWRCIGPTSVQYDDLSGLLEAYFVTGVFTALNITLSAAIQVDGVFETDTSV
jgi:hypothetical protein